MLSNALLQEGSEERRAQGLATLPGELGPAGGTVEAVPGCVPHEPGGTRAHFFLVQGLSPGPHLFCVG